MEPLDCAAAFGLHLMRNRRLQSNSQHLPLVSRVLFENTVYQADAQHSSTPLLTNHICAPEACLCLRYCQQGVGT